MPKMQNVTEAEIKAAIDSEGGEDMLMAIHDFNNRLEKGYCDHLEKPVTLARKLTAYARAASQLAAHILARAELQEQKAELAAVMRERAALKSE